MMNQLLRYWDPLPAAEAVSGNHDLITDILLRLPVKSLLRFKCVSKEWLSLISDSRFCRHHRSLASAGIILCRTNGLIDHVTCGARNSCEQPFTSLSFINDSVGVKVLQSCNGLLLCSSFFELGKSRRYYICNPSTRQYLLLPHPNGCVESESTTILGVHLAFDPSKSPDYQVVCVRNYSASASPHDHYQIEIYSSERRSWRLSGSTFVAPFDMVFDNGVLWNGTIHWISPTGACLSFDIIQEQLGEMPSLPTNEKWSKRRLRYFNESGGHLHLIEVYGSSTTQFQVFVMNKDYSSWIPKYQVDLAAIVAAYPKMIRSYPDAQEIRFYVFSLLFVQENEENSLLLLHIPGTSISYNLRDKTFKKLFGFEENSNDANASLQIGCFHAHQFTETLASV